MKEIDPKSFGSEQFKRHLELFNKIWKEPWEVVKRNTQHLREMKTETVEFLEACPLVLRINYRYAVPKDSIPFDIHLPKDTRYLNLEAGVETLFMMYVFGDKTTGAEHVAVMKGVEDNKNVPVRIHSSCITAETFHASNCDCHEQAELALQIAEKDGKGGIIWLYQEGMGNGLVAKARQLRLMIEEGLDTISAYEKFGYERDQRDFRPAADILKILGISSVRLITNNPSKISKMRESGVNVIDMIPCNIQPINEMVARNLQSKKEKLGHIL